MRRVAAAGLLLVSMPCTSCLTAIHEQAAFKDARVVPAKITGHVGDVVAFDVRPPVSRDSVWELSCLGYARFAGSEHADLEWVARHPIPMEAVVSAWGPANVYEEDAARGWLEFVLQGAGAGVEPIGIELPVERLPYREIAPVTVTATYSNAPREPKLSSRVRDGRTWVTYRTPEATGVARAPRVRAMLLEDSGKKRLYAEVRTNFGASGKERLAYDVGMSYETSVGGPIEVVVVEWVGYGEYYGPFRVARLDVAAPAGDAQAPAPEAPTR